MREVPVICYPTTKRDYQCDTMHAQHSYDRCLTALSLARVISGIFAANLYLGWRDHLPGALIGRAVLGMKAS